ncbi:MAG: protein kinase [Gemmataceae bacterium]
MGQEAAEGLAAAHVLGLIHRDIKPANIWLEAPKGRVKILDFGIARRVAEQPGNGLTGANTVVGTTGYMSPEQAQCEQLDHRSGCVQALASCSTGADHGTDALPGRFDTGDPQLSQSMNQFRFAASTRRYLRSWNR